MTDDEKALIVRKDSAIERKSAGSKQILNRMVSDAVALANSKNNSLGAARFKIGDYEFKEPDYRLIVGWAELLDLSPEDVVGKLERSIYSFEDKEISFEVEDGSIISLVIDYRLVPIRSFICEKGLAIRNLAFIGKLERVSPTINLDLESLNNLYCSDINLAVLNLSNVPALTHLRCSNNQLTALDLTNVPALTYLWCPDSQLTALDLTNVPALTLLWCPDNQLTALDLTNVPALTSLYCHTNQLTALDLTNVDALTALYCHANQLTELDLSNVPALTVLTCSSNQLFDLDLSNVSELTVLYCHSNQLAELDLSNVPSLSRYKYDPDVKIIR